MIENSYLCFLKLKNLIQLLILLNFIILNRFFLNSFIFKYLPTELSSAMMNEQINPNLEVCEKQLYKASDNDPLRWKTNKEKMIEILKKAPVVGVYRNESRDQWNSFYKFYINFLNSELGPRGQCAKKIRQELKIHKQLVDEVLLPYNMDHKTHIRTIYVKFKYFIPCQEYQDYESIKQNIQKYIQNLSRIKQPTHPMYLSIKSGLLKKHGAEYPYLQQINKIQSKYEQNIQLLTQRRSQLLEKLNGMVEYKNYTQMINVMKKYFDKWVEADSGLGKDSCNRGQLFENKVLANTVRYIIQKQRNTVFSHILEEQYFHEDFIENLIITANQNATKKDKYKRLHIFPNIKWNPRAIGQIDIAIVEYIEQTKRYQALILIECKARLFDVREASYQVFVQYLGIDNNKIQLSGKYGPVYLSKKVTSYIVTTLPDFDFVLPIQSKLKQTLDKKTKDKPIQQMNEQSIKQILFNDCIDKFQQELSPLQWFMNNSQKNIIVLSSQT